MSLQKIITYRKEIVNEKGSASEKHAFSGAKPFADFFSFPAASRHAPGFGPESLSGIPEAVD